MRIVPEDRRTVQPGQKFGRLTVSGVPFYMPAPKWRLQFAVCLCDCGQYSIVRATYLTMGHTASCGCIKACGAKGYQKRPRPAHWHGMRHHPLYRVYQSMMTRCFNQKSAFYSRYGGRGISVCDEWNGKPKAFLEWAVANGYASGLELDRRDNDRGYSPDNCRFVTHEVNTNNRAVSIHVTAWGETKTISQWARDSRCVVTWRTLYDRIRDLGWSVERSISTPSRKCHA